VPKLWSFLTKDMEMGVGSDVGVAVDDAVADGGGDVAVGGTGVSVCVGGMGVAVIVIVDEGGTGICVAVIVIVDEGGASVTVSGTGVPVGLPPPQEATKVKTIITVAIAI
jgi:hypothetical protein